MKRSGDPKKPTWKKDDEVSAYDGPSQTFADATVVAVMRDDGERLVRVKFADGGRCGLLRPAGVRHRSAS